MSLDIDNKDIMKSYFTAARDTIFNLWARQGNSLVFAGALFECEGLRRKVYKQWKDYKCKRMTAVDFKLTLDELTANLEHVIHLSQPITEDPNEHTETV